MSFLILFGPDHTIIAGAPDSFARSRACGRHRELEQVTISHDRLAADPAGPRPWIEHRTAPSQLRPPSACRTWPLTGGRGRARKATTSAMSSGPPESPESRRICDPVDKCGSFPSRNIGVAYRAGCDRLLGCLASAALSPGSSWADQLQSSSLSRPSGQAGCV